MHIGGDEIERYPLHPSSTTVKAGSLLGITLQSIPGELFNYIPPQQKQQQQQPQQQHQRQEDSQVTDDEQEQEVQDSVLQREKEIESTKVEIVNNYVFDVDDQTAHILKEDVHRRMVHLTSPIKILKGVTDDVVYILGNHEKPIRMVYSILFIFFSFLFTISHIITYSFSLYIL